MSNVVHAPYPRTFEKVENTWNAFDKDTDSIVLTLEADGSLRLWVGVRYDPPWLILPEDVQEAANLLRSVREYFRALDEKYHHVYWRATPLDCVGRPGRWAFYMYWYPRGTLEYSLKTPDIGASFLRDVASWTEYEKRREAAMPMTEEKIAEACSKLAEVLGVRGYLPRRLTDAEKDLGMDALAPDRVREHYAFMLTSIPEFVEQRRREKAMRWLGFLQGVAYGASKASIMTLAQMNMPDAPEQTDHSTHGRGTAEDGPDGSDCACRGTVEEAECARQGCGFCTPAVEVPGGD